MPWRMAVVGRSMEPTLRDGDRILVLPAWTGLRRRLRVGDLVVLRDPSGPRLVVKRLAALPGGQAVVDGQPPLQAGDGVIVLGDNAPASTDSKTYGAVDLRSVRGRAWYRYAPPDRAGRLLRPGSATS